MENQKDIDDLLNKLFVIDDNEYYNAGCRQGIIDKIAVDDNMVHHLSGACNNMMYMIFYNISKIYSDKKSGVTVVIFRDGHKTIVHRYCYDKDSIYTAAAYAVIKRLYGSTRAFKKEVDAAINIKKVKKL